MSTVSASAFARADSLAPPTERGYFQRALPGDLILGAFAFLTLPLTAFVLFYLVSGVIWVYLWLFGMTHFVLTFTVYLQSANLKHFAKTWRNQFLFFGIPIGLFVLFDLYNALGIAVWFPLFHLGFQCVIRFADFFHFSRQGFGVLQMFKAESGGSFPKWAKRIENYYLLSLTGLLFITFLEGLRSSMPIFPLLNSLPPEDDRFALVLWSASWIGVTATAGLLAALVIGYRQATGKLVSRPLLYLLAQSASAALAILFLPLYVATLAIHYVEYHVLMYPRCFHTPLDPDSRLDRFFARLRQNPWIFYAVIIATAGIITLILQQSMGAFVPGAGELGRPMTFQLMLALFDGIFVFHYFIEAFIWRFSDSHFRASMSGLYFKAQARTSP